MSETNQLTAITGFLIKHRRSPLFSSPGNEPVASNSSTESAVAFAADLEMLGPTFIKIGQMLSTRADLIPPEYLVALGRLQDRAEPLAWSVVEEIIERELGSPIRKIFTRFDKEPLGTASFAQVHSAQLPSGKEVAVKVQRPNLLAQVDADLLTMKRLVSSLGLVSNLGTRLGFSDWLEEFRKSVHDELDYQQEANNLETFQTHLEKHPSIKVPMPVWNYSTQRVLTMDRAVGIRVTQIPDVLRTEVDLSTLANELASSYLDQIFIHGLLHADPHPGNILFTPEHGLVLLDLGMVAYLPPRLRDQLLKLVMGIVDGRGERVGETFIRLGSRSEHFEEERFMREVGRMVARFSTTSRPTESDGSFILSLIKLGADCGIKPPAELVMLGKTLLNLESVILALAPNVTMREVLRDHVAEVLMTRTTESFKLDKLATDAIELQEFLRHAPQRLGILLRTLSDNRFRVHIAGLEESRLIENMQKIANRITVGLIASAMIIGAALIMRIPTASILFGYPTLALMMFIFAAGLGLALVVSVLLEDRRARPRVDRDPL